MTGYKDELLDRTPRAIVIQKAVKEAELTEAVRRVLARGHSQGGLAD